MRSKFVLRASLACVALCVSSMSFAGEAMPSDMEMMMLNMLVDGAHKCELRYPAMKPQAEALYASLANKYPRVPKSTWKQMQRGSSLDLDPLPLTEAECINLLNAKREGPGAEVTQLGQGPGKTPIVIAEEPPAASPTILASADLDQIVSAVLAHPEVSKYLHPEVPGRVPVVVRLAAPYESEALRVEAFGQAVRAAKSEQPGAVSLKVAATGAACRVDVKYRPEGIFGHVDLALVDGAWKVTDATIYE